MVEVAAIIAQAASTALPPRWNIIAPAVARERLAGDRHPVPAVQRRLLGLGEGAGDGRVFRLAEGGFDWGHEQRRGEGAGEEERAGVGRHGDSRRGDRPERTRAPQARAAGRRRRDHAILAPPARPPDRAMPRLLAARPARPRTGLPAGGRRDLRRRGRRRGPGRRPGRGRVATRLPPEPRAEQPRVPHLEAGGRAPRRRSASR